MTKFIELSMFIDQHKGKSSSYSSRDVAQSTFMIPFKQWKPGYVLVSARSESDEEWTIKNISSADGTPSRENCTIDLINKSQELRSVLGSTAQSGYKFKSTGDVPPPAPEMREDVKPICVNVEGIREFYPRNNNEGTRMLMHDKTTYIVLESFSAVRDMIISKGISVGSHGNGSMTGAEIQGN